MDVLQRNYRPIERDVTLLGTAFVLGKKNIKDSKNKISRKTIHFS